MLYTLESSSSCDVVVFVVRCVVVLVSMLVFFLCFSRQAPAVSSVHSIAQDDDGRVDYEEEVPEPKPVHGTKLHSVLMSRDVERAERVCVCV